MLIRYFHRCSKNRITLLADLFIGPCLTESLQTTCWVHTPLLSSCTTTALEGFALWSYRGREIDSLKVKWGIKVTFQLKLTVRARCLTARALYLLATSYYRLFPNHSWVLLTLLPTQISLAKKWAWYGPFLCQVWKFYAYLDLFSYFDWLKPNRKRSQNKKHECADTSRNKRSEV